MLNTSCLYPGNTFVAIYPHYFKGIRCSIITLLSFYRVIACVELFGYKHQNSTREIKISDKLNFLFGLKCKI